MFQVPTGIWQEIAKAHPEMTSRWGKAMAGGQEAIDKLLREVEQEQEAQGVPNGVTLAFEVVAPCLVEADRIQAWNRETDQLELRAVLLDVLEPEDAAAIGAMEYRLTPEERELLKSLLTEELNRPPDPPANQDSGRGGASSATYELDVDGVHFRQGLRIFQMRGKVRGSPKALFSFDGDYLQVEAFDRSFLAHAAGVWPGVASVGATLLLALARVPPAGDGLHLRYSDGRMRLGAMTIDCRWQPVTNALLDLPSSPDWIEALSLKYRASRSRIWAAKLDKDVAAAEKKLARLVSRVEKSLAPFGVTSGEIAALIERRLIERWAARPDAES
jgi:hypothetical protein